MTFEDAVGIACDAHRGQVDKKGDPYILHVLRVALSVPARDRVVAVLHDVIEDTGCPTSLLEPPALSSAEWDALDLLTRTGQSYGAYIMRLCEAKGEAAAIAREVKRADLRDNLGRIAVTDYELADLRERYSRALEVLSHV